MIDFGAPESALAGAQCPFSSSFDDTSGYRYNDLLVMPYDDVNPDKFG